MKKYYDPLYGEIKLDELVFSIIEKCPEIKRLRYVGLMNFKSLSMLPLTSITRLEHTIGLSYLAQLFADSNSFSKTSRNNLIVASLFHDVNSASFGHAIEWAVDRYTPYNHEKETEWLADKEKTSFLNKKPIFIEQYGVTRYDLEKEYGFNLTKAYQIINGVDSFTINNNGIDLDNVDNVFRMGLYMGLEPFEKGCPVRLAKSLKIVDGRDNFVIKEEAIDLVMTWYQLRANIYGRFIYSEEYMGYEYLLFQLIAEYAKHVEFDSIRNLFNYTDENLLWHFYDKKNSLPSVSNIASMLLLHDIPKTYAILRSDEFDKKEKLIKPGILDAIAQSVSEYLHNSKEVSNTSSGEIFLHLTTDDRKTNRQIDFYVEKSGEVVKQSIGFDKRYIVIGVLGKKNLSEKVKTLIAEKTIEKLRSSNLGNFDNIEFVESNALKQKVLF